MNWKRKRLIYFGLGVFAPLLFWWGVTSVFGTNHEVVAGVLYAIYLFLLTLLFNIYQGRTFAYTGLLLLIGGGRILYGLVRFFLMSGENAADSFSAVFNLVLTISTTLVAVGVSCLAYLLLYLFHAIRNIRD